jgi:hypothetical protein
MFVSLQWPLLITFPTLATIEKCDGGNAVGIRASNYAMLSDVINFSTFVSGQACLPGKVFIYVISPR